jgi:membrane protein DedA with SNARE-associated domain
MSFNGLIESHGYWLLALGCLLEGETLLLLAGWAAHRGLLDPAAVLVIAAASGFTGDQGFFWLGRRHGPALLRRWPAWASRVERVHALMARWRDGVIVFVRFAYGLRTAGPVIIGMSDVSALRFACFNALGALLWACSVGGAGWIFGQAAEALLGRIHDVEVGLLLVLAVAGLGFWLWRRLRGR